MSGPRLLILAAFLLIANAVLFSDAAVAQDTRYTCTEFLGYSQTGQWYPYAAQQMVNGGIDRVQARLHDGGAAIRWADPNYDGWLTPVTGPCTNLASDPDRVILDVTHYDYLTAAHGASDPVGFMETIIRNAVATIHVKHPHTTSIVLQPVAGGPNHGTCPIGGMAPGDPGVVRASYNHPYIDQAISRVVGGDVTRGYDNLVRTCSDYADWMGHLVSNAFSPIGQQVGVHYRDLWMVTPTPTATAVPTNVPTFTPIPSATPTGTPTSTPVPSATPIPATATPSPEPTVGAMATTTPQPLARCYNLVRVNGDGSIEFIDEQPCP